MKLKLNYGEIITFDKFLSASHGDIFSTEYIKHILKCCKHERRYILKKFTHAFAFNYRFPVIIRVQVEDIIVIYSEMYFSITDASIRIKELCKQSLITD